MKNVIKNILLSLVFIVTGLVLGCLSKPNADTTFQLGKWHRDACEHIWLAKKD